MDGTINTLSQTSLTEYIAMTLAAIELARRVASITPGKTDDEIVSKIERLFRVLIDAFAGQHANRNDPGMIKSKD